MNKLVTELQSYKLVNIVTYNTLLKYLYDLI